MQQFSMAVPPKASRNIIFVHNTSKMQQPVEIQPDEQDLLFNMTTTEPICQKIQEFFMNVIETSEIILNKKSVPEEEGEAYIVKQFLKDAVFYFLSFGFVPFRLRKVNKKMLPFVVPYHKISWHYQEDEDDEMSTNIQVEYKSSFDRTQKEKTPRIYVYPFSSDQTFGVFFTALHQYTTILKSRKYYCDYLEMNKQHFLLCESRSQQQQRPEYDKTNINQILNVSEHFRFEMDSSIEQNDMKEEEKNRNEQLRENIKDQTQNNKVWDQFCSNILLPKDNTAHLQAFKPPSIDMNYAETAFKNAILDSVHIPYSWHGQNTQSSTQGITKPGQESLEGTAKNPVSKTNEAVSMFKKQFEKMTSFIMTMLNDENNNKKIEAATTTRKRKHRQINDNPTINILNLYMFPVDKCELKSISTQDISFLYSMYTKFIISHEEFSNVFETATGLTVDKQAKELHEEQLKAQKNNLKNLSMALPQAQPGANKNKTGEQQQSHNIPQLSQVDQSKSRNKQAENEEEKHGKKKKTKSEDKEFDDKKNESRASSKDKDIPKAQQKSKK